MRVHDEVDLLAHVADGLIRKLLPARGAHLAMLAALKVAQELHDHAVVIVPAAHVVRLAHRLVLVAHQVLIHLDIEVADGGGGHTCLDHVLVVLVEGVLEQVDTDTAQIVRTSGKRVDHDLEHGVAVGENAGEVERTTRDDALGEREQTPLARSHVDLALLVYHKVAIEVGKTLEQLGHTIRVHPVVAIHHAEIAPARLGQAGIHGRTVASVLLGDNADHAMAARSELLRKRTGAVGGAIVHNDNLEIAHEARVEVGLEATREVGLDVVRGNGDGELWRRCVERVLRHEGS